jgi:hypothetical protein
MAGKRTGNNKSDAGANSGETHGSGTAANGNSADSGDDSGIPSIDPASLSSDASSDASAGDSAKRKRGRPLGVRNSNGPSARAEKQTASDLSGLLLSIHLALGALTKVEELKLDEEEAERLGKAVARVNEEFGGVILSPKQTAVINLLTCGVASMALASWPSGCAKRTKQKQRSAARKSSMQFQSWAGPSLVEHRTDAAAPAVRNRATCQRGNKTPFCCGRCPRSL